MNPPGTATTRAPVHDVRAYRAADAAACLALFDGNTPDYFAPGERADFARFLDALAGEHGYLVIEAAGRVVACGGLTLSPDGTAGFCWGMVARQRQRQGLGRQLALARLQQARQHPQVRQVVLSTSQHTEAFYAGLGFRVTGRVANGHGPGLDAVDMRLLLDER
jgi:predicted GNAT family N-acyltransferase